MIFFQKEKKGVEKGIIIAKKTFKVQESKEIIWQ